MRDNPEERVVEAICEHAEALGWRWERETQIPGWGRTDILLYPSEYLKWLVEAKAELVTHRDLRRALVQVNGYRPFVSPDIVSIVANWFHSGEGAPPYHEWGRQFDTTIYDLEQMRDEMDSWKRAVETHHARRALEDSVDEWRHGHSEPRPYRLVPYLSIHIPRGLRAWREVHALLDGVENVVQMGSSEFVIEHPDSDLVDQFDALGVEVTLGESKLGDAFCEPWPRAT